MATEAEKPLEVLLAERTEFYATQPQTEKLKIFERASTQLAQGIIDAIRAVLPDELTAEIGTQDRDGDVDWVRLHIIQDGISKPIVTFKIRMYESQEIGYDKESVTKESIMDSIYRSLKDQLAKVRPNI